MGPPFGQMFPPSPSFTERNIRDLKGKVFIVTGATSGVGFEAASILYSKGATVYIGARSADKAKKAISTIEKTEKTSTPGRLVFFFLDLSDLSSVKSSAEEFLGQENRLDVVIHNAGVMTPPPGSKTKLGHDLEMGTNCLGPFLLNHFLLPLLKATAAISEKDSVRVVWLSSMVAISTPEGGILFDNETGQPKVLKNAMENYMESKAGNLFFASELAKRVGNDGIISVSVNPGLMKTELQRHSPAPQRVIMGILFKGPRHGAYSELFGALSPSITSKENGTFIIPWGRIGPIPSHVEKSLKPVSSGGTGIAAKFWEWCEKETAPYQ